MRTLALDIETYSDVDLTKSGVYKYAESVNFQVLLIGYAFDDGDVNVIDLAQGEELPDELISALIDPNVLKTAYNSNFERVCLTKHFDWPVWHPPEQWSCTAVLASTLGLPGYLDGVAQSMKLDTQKDSAGKNLIRYFCMPCKATKANEGRTRNLPAHDPERWQQFREYCRQDVIVEREIRRRLQQFPLPDKERRLWYLDQHINDRGVGVDRVLVEHAIHCDVQFQERMLERAKQVSKLDNPNSPQQLKGWLSDRGVDVESLNKATVTELLETVEDDEVRTMLELRQQMSKTSVKKYQALERAWGADDKVRGLLQFYGASRTGRWASRLINIQNLPQNKLPDLDAARGLLRSGHYEMLALLYDNVPSVLSQLIRTTLVPSEGCRFIVADFASIEARVLAWLAGEQWVLDVFQGHGKIYEMTASRMTGVPLDQIAKDSPLRQKGKVATLACIAEGQLVLTDKGLVAIEDVTCAHRLWDGEDFVQHEGVLFKGEGEVMTYDGLTATKDHIVWVEGQSEPIQFGEAAANRSRLVQTGDGGKAIRLGSDYRPRETVDQELESLLGAHAVYQLPINAVDQPKQPNQRGVQGMSALLSTQASTAMAGSKTHSRKTAVRESQRCGLRELWGQGDPVSIYIGDGSGSLGHKKLRVSQPLIGDRQDQQRWALRGRQSALCHEIREFEKHPVHRAEGVGSRRLAILSKCGTEEIEAGDEQGSYLCGCAESRGRKTEELEVHRSQARLFDIVNAGPNNRFTVSGRLVHNCGYQGSTGALIAMGALKMGLAEDELPGIVKAWRTANPKIVQFWWDVEAAAIEAVKQKTSVSMQHGLTFRWHKGVLFITLPSGRSLAYARPRIERDTQFRRPQLTYEGAEIGSKTWSRVSTFSGKIAENLTQAIARDCLAEAMLRLDHAGYRIAFHVHDEVILDSPQGEGSVDEVCRIMSQPIDWAPGLPLATDGYACSHYQKS